MNDDRSRHYLPASDICRMLNMDGQPEGRELRFQRLWDWARAGYVRTAKGRRGELYNMLDVIPCVIAARAGKKQSGRWLSVCGIERPAAYTDPAKVRALHQDMLKAGFSPILRFTEKSPPPEPSLLRLIREHRANGLGYRRISKLLGIDRSLVLRAFRRSGRFAP